MTVSDLQLGYAAGIIDGEGCIYIPKNCGSVYLKVAMGHKPAVQALQQTFNCGTIQDVTPVGYNQAWSWLCSTRDCIAVLKLVRPLLIVKAREADIAFEYDLIPRSPQGGSPYRGKQTPAWITEARRDCWDRMRRAKPSFVFREIADATDPI